MATPSLQATAQQAQRVYRIGYLSSNTSGSGIALRQAFLQRLRDFGYIERQTIEIKERYANGQLDHLPSLATELVQSGLDVLVAWSPPGAVAAKRSTNQVPVVFLAAADPVKSGLVSSLSHPGGNVTGVSFDVATEVYEKAVELLKEAVPSLTRLARLVSIEQGSGTAAQAINDAARRLGIAMHDIVVRQPAELHMALRKAKAEGIQALYVQPRAFTYAYRKQIALTALANRLPSLHMFSEAVIDGGLLCYAPSMTHIAQAGARIVDKILKGAKPGDIPVEQPTNFELVMNLKTARALNLTIPPALLLRADQVIE